MQVSYADHYGGIAPPWLLLARHTVLSPGPRLAGTPSKGQNGVTFRSREMAKTGAFCRVPKIDKAFRIGKPMRKASWTMRFVAGWGERGPGCGDRQRSFGWLTAFGRRI